MTSSRQAASLNLVLSKWLAAVERIHGVNSISVMGEQFSRFSGRIREGTRFPIASQSKMFTAVLILKAIEQKKLKLDTRLCQLLPISSQKSRTVKDITILQLLSHTSRLPRDLEESHFWTEAKESFPDREELLSYITDRLIVVDRRHVPKYSNLGFALLGSIIEEVYNSSYPEVLADQISNPLGLGATSCHASNLRGRGVLTGEPIPTKKDTKSFVGATGIHSTLSDLSVFLGSLALPSKRLLNQETKKLAFTPLSFIDGGARGLGLGFMTLPKLGLIGHVGAYFGCCSASWFSPRNGNVLSCFVPFNFPGIFNISKEIWALTDKLRLSKQILSKPGIFNSIWGTMVLAPCGEDFLWLDASSFEPLQTACHFKRQGRRIELVQAPGLWAVGEEVRISGRDGRRVLTLGSSKYREVNWR